MNDLEAKIIYKCRKHLEDAIAIWDKQDALIDELPSDGRLIFLQSLVGQFADAKKQVVISRNWLLRAGSVKGRETMTSLEHYALRKVQKSIMESGQKMREVDSKTFLQTVRVDCSNIHLRYYKGSEVNRHLSTASAWMHALLANKTELDRE